MLWKNISIKAQLYYSFFKESDCLKNSFWSNFVKPSTRSFYQEGKSLTNYSFWDWLHGYIYSRWPYLYIGVGTGEHRLTKFFMPIWRLVSKFFHFESDGKNDSKRVTFADTYHGKVVPWMKPVGWLRLISRLT